MQICQQCKQVFDAVGHLECPRCGALSSANTLSGGDALLKEHMPLVLEERKRLGLDQLSGGLACVIINTEKDRQDDVVQEFIDWTGYSFRGGFRDVHFSTCMLGCKGSADILIRSRHDAYNPFGIYNQFPKSFQLPNTRLETYVFETSDIETLVEIQKNRGVQFLTEFVVYSDNFAFIQTPPSRFTGTSIGFIEWRHDRGTYNSGTSQYLARQFPKPDRPYLADIGFLDHAAARVRAEERNNAILETMILTNYTFDFAIEVEALNSITSVLRISPEQFALVITSGRIPYVSDDDSGPTAKFVHNYGVRTHHLAFRTGSIERVVGALADDGREFMSDLLGSPDDGLHQIFSATSDHSLLVTEYIHRYDGFDGFFTRHNVTELTRATDLQ